MRLFNFAFLAAFFTSINLVSSDVSAQAPSPQKTREQRIEQILEIHYLKPEMKSSFDRLEIKGNQVFISVWRELPPEPRADKIECQGYQWLLTGRGQKIGQGAAAVFREFSDIQSIELELIKVDHSLESTNDKHGEYKKVPKATPYLSMSVERNKVLNVAFTKEMFATQSECLKWGRSVVSKKEIKL